MPLPKWSYAFIVACVLIPIVTLGGAVPALVGVGGAAGCAAIARDESKPASKRVALCLGVTALSWAVFAAFGAIVGSLKSP